MNYKGNVKAGRYEIPAGIGVYALIKKLRSGDQAPINFTINPRVKTIQQLAAKIGKSFECDSAAAIAFLSDNEKMKALGTDTFNVLASIIPNTYSLNWNSSPEKIFKKLKSDCEQFWKENGRLQKAEQLGYDAQKIYTLASVVEEETNLESDRGNIASVYLNRLKKGMRLQADPTVKFAMRDFQLKRILLSHLAYVSPYNTYLNAGLPPGPICTVSGSTIDAVLSAPQTEYLFFVAKASFEGDKVKFDGSSVFTTNNADHERAAKDYQKAIGIYLKNKAAEEKRKQDSIAAAK
jgi:UPF0755 protein